VLISVLQESKKGEMRGKRRSEHILSEKSIFE
jgi:hypothetical protein